MLLKKTRSLCPTCSREIPADIVARNGKVWMCKRCADHGPFEALVEEDEDFYKATVNTPPEEPIPARWLVVPVTHRCNLDCPLCFVPDRRKADLSRERLRAALATFPGEYIALSGGEPTLHPGLCDLIAEVRAAGKRCALMSNGIRLAERALVDRLVEAGLQGVLLAFNGMNDPVYEATNGRPLLHLKLKALRNCTSAGLSVSLSATVFRGINEDVGPIVDLCLREGVVELRIRGACRVGRHPPLSPLKTSELFRGVATALGTDMPTFLRRLQLEKRYHSSYQVNLLCLFRRRADYQHELLAWNSGSYRRSCCDIETYTDLMESASCTAPDPAFRFLEISVWGWPDAGNIDLDEITAHGVYHLVDDSLCMNFPEAVLQADRL